MQATDRYVVIGQPVAHSKSPEIHARFAAQTGQCLTYGRLPAPLDGFAQTVRDFMRAGGKGANVTVPFKLEALRLATSVSPRALAAGAVNTLMFDGDAIFGDNTDGVGLVTDIVRNAGVALAGKSVLLLGAGGAARGVILPLAGAGSGANSSSPTAPPPVRLSWRSALPPRGRLPPATSADLSTAFDIIINATSASLEAQMPPLPAAVFGADTFCYDMMYGAQPTVFMQFAKQHGARTRDGLGMLVEQAAESFFLWRGVRPATRAGTGRVAGSTRRCRMRRLLRWALWLIGTALALVLVLQLYFFLQIGWWVRHNPESTSFMQRQLSVLQEKNPRATLQHQWVPYQRISRHLKRAIIAAEDSSFAEHQGVDWEALEKAYQKNQKKGRVVAGGSTITQQLAKNLFLSGQRSYLRKGQEFIITYMLEFWMDKERIFEIYLNVVEWGNGVFGAEAAARHYYGVAAADLSPAQAARLAVMLPNPRYYDKNRGSAYLERRAALILRRMGAAELPWRSLPNRRLPAASDKSTLALFSFVEQRSGRPDSGCHRAVIRPGQDRKCVAAAPGAT